MQSRLFPTVAVSVLIVSLASGRSTILDDSAPGDAPELVGDEWFVETISGRDVLSNTSPSIGFVAGGNVFGNATCNLIVGT